MRWLTVVGLLALGLLVWGAWGLLGEPAVRQPLGFSHKKHMELKKDKLECTSCHTRAKEDAVAGRPSTKKCLSCHSGAKAKTEDEKKLQALGERGDEILWKRVWRLPSHVYFSHRTHVVVPKVKCQTCHGSMERLDRALVRALKKLTMDDCISCHEKWEWPKEEEEKAAKPVKEAKEAEPVKPDERAKPVKPEEGAKPVQAVAERRVTTDCNACHR